jgi:hypothetical protein
MSGFKIWSRTAEYLSLNDIRPPPLAQLYAYWQKCRSSDEDLPAQQDLSLREVPECMGNLALVALETAPAGARYLLVGPALKKLLGADPTGKRIDEIYSRSIAREVYDAFGRAARDRTPSFYQRDFEILGRSFGYYRLILPLRLGEGEGVRRLLVGIYPTSDRLTEADQWRGALADLEAQERKEDEMQRAWLRSFAD